MHGMEESASEQPCEQMVLVLKMSSKRHESQRNSESRVGMSNVKVYYEIGSATGVEESRVLGESGQGHRISKHRVRVWRR
jgi:hypothetical protein